MDTTIKFYQDQNSRNSNSQDFLSRFEPNSPESRFDDDDEDLLFGFVRRNHQTPPSLYHEIPPPLDSNFLIVENEEPNLFRQNYGETQLTPNTRQYPFFSAFEPPLEGLEVATQSTLDLKNLVAPLVPRMTKFWIKINGYSKEFQTFLGHLLQYNGGPTWKDLRRYIRTFAKAQNMKLKELLCFLAEILCFFFEGNQEIVDGRMRIAFLDSKLRKSCLDSIARCEGREKFLKSFFKAFPEVKAKLEINCCSNRTMLINSSLSIDGKGEGTITYEREDEEKVNNVKIQASDNFLYKSLSLQANPQIAALLPEIIYYFSFHFEFFSISTDKAKLIHHLKTVNEKSSWTDLKLLVESFKDSKNSEELLGEMIFDFLFKTDPAFISHRLRYDGRNVQRTFEALTFIEKPKNKEEFFFSFLQHFPFYFKVLAKQVENDTKFLMT